LAKFAKVFKVAKPLLMFASMSISMLAYAFWMGPWLGILFTLLLLVHEMGHVAAMKIKGFETPTPVFIPFIGAAVFAPKFGDRNDEAFVGYGGPLLGSAAAIMVFLVYLMLPADSKVATILLAASYVGVFLNLFNMIPISPLDGGRVTQAVGTWFRYIGMIVLAGVSIMLRSPVILYVWVLVVTDLTFIPVKIRAVLTTIMGVSMAILMAMGYGDQPTWINVIDCIFVSAFVGINIVRAIKPETDEPVDTRPNLTKEQRWQWSLLYLGLFATLVLTIMAQSHYLPHHVG
jgi:Zn-dependent protease